MITIKGKYTSPIIYTDNIEEEALKTIKDIANDPTSKYSKIRIMPDVHQGVGTVIGFTTTMTSSNVNPSYIGLDIGCSVSTSLYNIPFMYSSYEYKERFEECIRQYIYFGKEINPLFYTEEEKELILDSLMEFIKAIDKKNQYHIDKKYIKKCIKKVGMDEDIFYRSLGSIGGGNHFVEVGYDERNKDVIGVTVHTGSRNFGAKVANYYIKIAKNNTYANRLTKKEIENIVDLCTKDNRRHEIPNMIQNRRDILERLNPSRSGFLRGKNITNYIIDMIIAVAYAKLNHAHIHKIIKDIINTNFKRPCNDSVYIISTHNYIDNNDLIMRKGAVAAHRNSLLLVPFNMRDGIAICKGLGNERWNFSCSHGAGRKLSRTKAKETLSLEDYKKQMNNIVTTSVCKETLDEAPSAYKDTKTIINEIKDTVDIVTFIRPLINIKGIN